MDNYQGYNSASDQYKVKSITGENKRPYNYLTSGSLQGGSWGLEDSGQYVYKDGYLPPSIPIAQPVSDDEYIHTTMALMFRAKYSSTMPNNPNQGMGRTCLAPYSRAIIDTNLTETPRLLDNLGGFCEMFCSREEPVITNLTSFEVKYFDNFGPYYARTLFGYISGKIDYNFSNVDPKELDTNPAKTANYACINYPEPGLIVDRKWDDSPEFVFYKEGVITSATLMDGVYKARNSMPINIFLRQEYNNPSGEVIIRVFSNLNGLIGTINTSSMSFIYEGLACYYFNPYYVPSIGEEITVEIEPVTGICSDYKLRMLIGVYGQEVNMVWPSSPSSLIDIVGEIPVPFNSFCYGILMNSSFSLQDLEVRYNTVPFISSKSILLYFNSLSGLLFKRENQLDSGGVVKISARPISSGAKQGLLVLRRAHTLARVSQQISGSLDPLSYNLRANFPINKPATYTWSKNDFFDHRVYYENLNRFWPKPGFGPFSTRVPFLSTIISTGFSIPPAVQGSNGLFGIALGTGNFAIFNNVGRLLNGSWTTQGEGVFPIGQVIGESYWGLPPEMFLRQNLIDVSETQPTLFNYISTYPQIPFGDFPNMDFPLPFGYDYIDLNWPIGPIHPSIPPVLGGLSYPQSNTFGVFSDPIYNNNTNLGLIHGFQTVVFNMRTPPNGSFNGFNGNVCYPFLFIDLTATGNGSEGFKLIRNPYPMNSTNFSAKYPTQFPNNLVKIQESSYAYFFAIDVNSFIFNEPTIPLDNWRAFRITPFIGQYEYSYSRTIGEYGICNSEQDPNRFWYGIKLGAYEPQDIDTGDNLYTSFGNVQRFGLALLDQNEDWIAPRYNITTGSGIVGVQGDTISKPIPTPTGVYTYEPFITGSEPIPPELTPAQLAFKDTHTVLLDGTAISCEPIGDIGEAIRLNQPAYVLQRFGRIEEINSVLTFVEEKTQVVTLKDIMLQASHISNQYITEIEVLTIKASPIKNI